MHKVRIEMQEHVRQRFAYIHIYIYKYLSISIHIFWYGSGAFGNAFRALRASSFDLPGASGSLRKRFSSLASFQLRSHRASKTTFFRARVRPGSRSFRLRQTVGRPTFGEKLFCSLSLGIRLWLPRSPWARGCSRLLWATLAERRVHVKKTL